MEAIFSKLEGRLSALEIQQRHAFSTLSTNHITNDVPQVAPKRRESGMPISLKESVNIRESFDFSGAAISMVSNLFFLKSGILYEYISIHYLGS